MSPRFGHHVQRLIPFILVIVACLTAITCAGDAPAGLDAAALAAVDRRFTSVFVRGLAPRGA